MHKEQQQKKKKKKQEKKEKEEEKKKRMKEEENQEKDKEGEKNEGPFARPLPRSWCSRYLEGRPRVQQAEHEPRGDDHDGGEGPLEADARPDPVVLGDEVKGLEVRGAQGAPARRGHLVDDKGPDGVGEGADPVEPDPPRGDRAVDDGVSCQGAGAAPAGVIRLPDDDIPSDCQHRGEGGEGGKRRGLEGHLR